jgi:hypothetical protein
MRDTRYKVVLDTIREEMPDVLLCDGFDEALIGVCVRFGQEPIAAYDYEKYLEILMRGGMNREEATEYFDFNVIGAWVGERTPCFLMVPRS